MRRLLVLFGLLITVSAGCQSHESFLPQHYTADYCVPGDCPHVGQGSAAWGDQFSAFGGPQRLMQPQLVPQPDLEAWPRIEPPAPPMNGPTGEQSAIGPSSYQQPRTARRLRRWSIRPALP